MSRADLQKAKTLVSKLTSDELKDLRGFVSLAIAVPSGKGGGVSREVDGVAMVLSTICDVCTGRGIDFSTPSMLMQIGGYATFKRKLEEQMIEFLKETAGYNRVMMSALIRLACELLCDDITAMNKSTNARQMMNHIHRLPQVLDRAFPGYARAGLLGIILKTEKQHVRTERR